MFFTKCVMAQLDLLSRSERLQYLPFGVVRASRFPVYADPLCGCGVQD